MTRDFHWAGCLVVRMSDCPPTSPRTFTYLGIHVTPKEAPCRARFRNVHAGLSAARCSRT